MKTLYEKLKKYWVKDALEIEKKDRQFLAIKKLWENFYDKNIFLALVIWNALVCYQLSWKWESYWEEFSNYFLDKKIKLNDVIRELQIFISNSKNNKRFTETKIARLNKLENFMKDFSEKWEYYFENLEELRDTLAKIMNQKIDAKTIVFAIKMFYYGAIVVFYEKTCSPNIFIPIDSRLTNLYEKYKEWDTKIKDFYFELSKKLNIPMLHLDAILWVNYDELIK